MISRLGVLALLGSLALVAMGAAGCHSAKSPELRVVGVHEEPRHDVVFVQVTNPASHAMRLTKLEYTFAADGATVSEGEVSLAREVPAGAAVVVEIPLDSPSEKPLILSGKLTAELNQIVQIFSVSAQIEPAK
ncbi:MAG TPA: LEA type 2 family protein [Kofleriaceae bacterium]|nr:LEA type 2 family protein [Kofleriaceae bacterium]